MPRKTGPLLLACIMILAAGCASTQSDPLDLENILEYKAKRGQAADEEGKSGAPLVSDAEPMSVGGQFDPPELSLLETPAALQRVTNGEPAFAELMQMAERLVPGASAFWQATSGDLILVAGKVPLNREAIESLDEREFEAEIKKLGEKYALFYNQKYGRIAHSEISRVGGTTVLKVACNYADYGYERRDVRYAYFYTPDYRLNVLLSGRQNSFDVLGADLEGRLAAFGEKLAQSGTAG